MSARSSNYAPSGRIVRRAGQLRSVVVVLGDEIVWTRDDAMNAHLVGWSFGIPSEHVDQMVLRALRIASESWIASFARGGRN